MNRCRLLVEGQSEETFANRLLIPHLQSHGFHEVTVTVVATKRPAGGGKDRGGITSWAKLRREIQLLCGDSGALVTTLIDFYGLPTDVPGMGDLQPTWDARHRVDHVEQAIGAAIGARNFVPHVMLHEFEALLYASPTAAASHFDDQQLLAKMAADLRDCGEPEMVDDGPDTAPSKRLMIHRPGYGKTTDGPAILADIGLPAIRTTCPHFDAWLSLVESHAP